MNSIPKVIGVLIESEFDLGSMESPLKQQGRENIDYIKRYILSKTVTRCRTQVSKRTN
jgi:hypothetical protein